MTSVWWVYILECRDGSLYTGITTDVARRLSEHEAGNGARYTRGRGPLRIAYQEQCNDRPAALRREAAIKRMSPRSKRLLCASSALPLKPAAAPMPEVG